MGPGPNDLGNSRYHLMRACKDSLRRLGTDHIDLYQIHRPSLEIPQFGQRVSRRGVEVARALAPLAQERGLTQSQFALLW
jgi:aryl-alcohol dehydrogenase-like predicted oxidoreductase